jgi:hypothetical protein
MRLLVAELIKLRRRWATYVVLAVLLVLMAVIYLLVGLLGNSGGEDTGFVIRFPSALGIINQFVFGLGSLLAVAYAAAIGGADWNWGVLRVIVGRGESRSRYVLVKALGLAVALLLGTLLAYAAGIALTYLAAALAGSSTGNLTSASSIEGLWQSIVFGFLVLIQRAAIGFAVAMLLRSQLAGVVVGIVLYIGEAILSSILIALSLRDRLGQQGIDTLETQWFQYLPFSIGDSVLAVAPNPAGDLSDLLLSPIELMPAVIGVLVYLAASVGASMLAAERAEIA